jgi:hypothetical protein
MYNFLWLSVACNTLCNSIWSFERQASLTSLSGNYIFESWHLNPLFRNRFQLTQPKLSNAQIEVSSTNCYSSFPANRCCFQLFCNSPATVLAAEFQLSPRETWKHNGFSMGIGSSAQCRDYYSLFQLTKIRHGAELLSLILKLCTLFFFKVHFDRQVSFNAKLLQNGHLIYWNFERLLHTLNLYLSIWNFRTASIRIKSEDTFFSIFFFKLWSSKKYYSIFVN